MLISHNEFRNLSLPNLKLIRGTEFFRDLTAFKSYFHPDGYSVVIFNNPNLEYLNLPSLRSMCGRVMEVYFFAVCFYFFGKMGVLSAIQKGNVFAKGNRLLCQWKTVDWSQVFREDSDSNQEFHDDFKKAQNLENCNTLGEISFYVFF